MYPLMFDPIYKEMLWGGSSLRDCFGRDIPSEKTGESWDISCRADAMGIIKNGIYTGRRFIDVIGGDRKNMLGTRLYQEKDFPLLVKLIDAWENLSVQVHPDDTYARGAEGYMYGKNEMWYILGAPVGAYLIIGLQPGVAKEGFKKALADGDVERLLGKLYIKKGDVINIPAGLVHAITAGVTLAEIQQNSDITYRVYDYHRIGADGKQRELHIDKAIDVIDFDGRLHTGTVEGLSVTEGGNTATYYIANNYFAIEKREIKGRFQDFAAGEKFYIYTCVGGGCVISGNGATVDLALGDSVFIPAALGAYEIVGDCTLIKSYVPDIRKDFIDPLKAFGYSDEEIRLKTELSDV